MLPVNYRSAARSTIATSRTYKIKLEEMQTVAELLENRQAVLAAENHFSWQKARIHLWVGFAFLLLFVVTVFLIAPKVQHKLDSQTRYRLQQAGINPATLQFDWDYRDLTVSGYLPQSVTHQQFATIVRGSENSRSSLFAQGIRNLRLDIDIASPTTGIEESLSVEVRSDGNVATLEGVVKDDAQRSLLVNAMLAGGVDDIYDNLDISGGIASPLLNEKILLLANILKESGPARATRTEVKMTDVDLYYRISAIDKASAQAIEKAATVKVDDFRITGGVDLPGNKHLDILARADGENITFTGTIGSEAQRRRLLFAAGEAIGGRQVIDQLTLDHAVFGTVDLMLQIEGVAAVVSRFAPGITGQVSLKGTELSVQANAGSEAVRNYLLASTAKAKSAGLSVSENIVLALPVDDTRALQAELDKLISEVRDSVVFASGDSDLSQDAKRTLDKVAAHINNYTDLLVEIEGHTDNVGRAKVNEQLSQSRANAVRNYLAQSAGDGSRLIAVGYGHRRPLEDNDTAEGRQANRRVHFTVLQRPENPSG